MSYGPIIPAIYSTIAIAWTIARFISSIVSTIVGPIINYVNANTWNSTTHYSTISSRSRYSWVNRKCNLTFKYRYTFAQLSRSVFGTITLETHDVFRHSQEAGSDAALIYLARVSMLHYTTINREFKFLLKNSFELDKNKI